METCRAYNASLVQENCIRESQKNAEANYHDYAIYQPAQKSLRNRRVQEISLNDSKSIIKAYLGWTAVMTMLVAFTFFIFPLFIANKTCPEKNDLCLRGIPVMISLLTSGMVCCGLTFGGVGIAAYINRIHQLQQTHHSLTI